MPDLEHAERLGVLDEVDERRAGIDARVGRVEPAGVGEQDEQVRAGQHRHLGGEEVVVAEADLVGGGRVVLVDDRDDAPVEQLAQRAARVDVVGARAHVEERQQHLRGGQPAVAQQLVVDAVELALADRARRLQVLDRARADRELEQPHAAGDRARGDDHHVDPLGVQRGDLVAHALEHAGAQVAGGLGDDGGSELDDEGGHGAPQVRSSQDRYMRRGRGALCCPACSETALPTTRHRRGGPRRRPGRRSAEPRGPRAAARSTPRARPVPRRAASTDPAPAPGRASQPVGGFSALLDGAARAAYLAMPDNGFGNKANSRSFLLRVYTVEARRGRDGSDDPHALDQPARPGREDPVRARQRGHHGALPHRRRLRHRVLPHRPPRHALVRRGVRPVPPAHRRHRQGARGADPAARRALARLPGPPGRHATTSTAPTASRGWRSRPTAARSTRRSKARSRATSPRVRRMYEFDIKERRYERGYKQLPRRRSDLSRLRPHRARATSASWRSSATTSRARRRPTRRASWSTPAKSARQARGRGPAGAPRPRRISLRDARPGDIGLGDPFSMPYVTIEAVLPVDKDELAIVNDTNFGSNGRNPALRTTATSSA